MRCSTMRSLAASREASYVPSPRNQKQRASQHGAALARHIPCMHAGPARSTQHGPVDGHSTLPVSQQGFPQKEEPVQTCSGGPSSRRHLLSAALLATAVSTVGVVAPRPATAIAGMVRFPCNTLGNRYFLVRAGISFAEERGTTVTNPVWKTSQMMGLSKQGVKQVYQQVVPQLRALGACEDGCWLWPSITQGSYQTAEIIAYELGMGRDRIVPEYSFLDMRGLGALEDGPVEQTLVAVAQGDAMDPGWKPAPNTDGTPHESVADVLVRVRQMISICETQYSGADILIISPDSYNLSVLQAAVLGVDLRRHNLYALQPGETRLLQLSDTPFDDKPRQFSCPDPPKCTQSVMAM